METPQNNLGAAARKGLKWSFLQRVTARGTSLLVFFVLARKLDPIDFGLVAIASIFIDLMTPLVDQGFGVAIVQKKEINHRHLNTAFWISITIGLVAMTCALTFATQLGPIIETIKNWIGTKNDTKDIDQAQLASVLQYLSIGLAFAPLAATPSAILQRNMDFKKVALITVACSWIGSIVGLTLALTGFGVWALVWMRLTPAPIRVFWTFLAAKWLPKGEVAFKEFFELAEFGSFITLTRLLEFLNTRSDVMVIGSVLGGTALGFYTTGQRMLTQIRMLLVNSVTTVALPVFSKLQDDKPKLKDAYFKAIRTSAGIIVPVYLVILILAKDVLLVTLGSKWLPSLGVMKVFCLVGIIHALSFFNATVIVSMGKSNWRFCLGLGNTAVNVILFVVLVKYGIEAVAIGFFSRAFLFAPLSFYLVARLLQCPLSEFLTSVIPFLWSNLIVVGTCIAISYLLRLVVDIPLITLLMVVPASFASCYVYLRRFENTFVTQLVSSAGFNRLFPSKTVQGDLGKGRAEF